MVEFDVRTTVVAIPGTDNVRDLGGLPTADDRRVRFGRLFRAEVLGDRTTVDGRVAVWDVRHAKQYESLGLRTVIDLRSPVEVAKVATAWARSTDADVVSLPLPEGGEGTDTNIVGDLLSGRRTAFSAEELGVLYAGAFDRRPAELGALVRLLAEPDRYPALVHCSAGKDRTGIVVALVLEVLGVPREVVIEDYALTGLLRPDRVEAYADMLVAAGVEPQGVRSLFETPVVSMSTALEHLDSTYGGAESYLIDHCGVAAFELTALRDNLTEQGIDRVES